MRTQHNVTLQCPACSIFASMRIMQKERRNGKVIYMVRCPQCNTVFQSGRMSNLWKTLRNQCNISAEEIRSLQHEMVEMAMRGDKVRIKDIGSSIFINGKLFVKQPRRK